MRSRWATIPNKEPPFFFQKNPDNSSSTGHSPIRRASSDVHHEIEMVVALKSGGSDIPVGKALDCVFGYGVGLDMTRRDLQGKAKDMGRPWEVGKAFEAPRPARRWCRRAEIGHPAPGAVWLDVNGERRQTGDLNQMIWKVPEMISYLSGLFRLAPGDIIMSGTPAGVGPVKRGDVLQGPYRRRRRSRGARCLTQPAIMEPHRGRRGRGAGGRSRPNGAALDPRRAAPADGRHRASGSTALGIGRGDRVAIVLPNGPEMATAFVSVAAAAARPRRSTPPTAPTSSTSTSPTSAQRRSSSAATRTGPAVTVAERLGIARAAG